jgi:hypothetical protein
VDGEYSFEFYFYVEERLPFLPVRDSYCFHGDKDYLIKRDKASSGYKKLIKITLPLFNGNFIFQLPYIAGQLSSALVS